MWDLMMIAVSVLFFALAIGYVHGCDRLGIKSGPREPIREAEPRP